MNNMNGGSFQKRAFVCNAVLALIVWSAWLLFGGHFALTSIEKNWPISLTMVIGSLVGGGTSEGGGAVAFPVFTKLLHIPPPDARLFAFAIQSVGMGAASLSILFLGIPIERRVLPWAGAAGILGMVVSTYFIVPNVPAQLVRITFTVMVSSLGVALVLLNRREPDSRHELLPVFGPREKTAIVAAGFVGGLVSGMVGCGENIATFMVMVLLFRMSEKVVTPTTVLLMTIVTEAGFGLHALVLHDFPVRVYSYWLAAVPIVAVGAPLGAYLCAGLSRKTIANILVCLISLEFVSTIILIPMSTTVGITALGALLVFGALNWQMSRTDFYRRNVQTSVPIVMREAEQFSG